MSSTPTQLLNDLESVGIQVADLWDLVNAKFKYPEAIPVLIDWLRNLDSRASVAEIPRLREGLVRALTVSAARPAAASLLIDEFRKAFDPSGLGERWIIGNALSVVEDESVFDEIESILRDQDYGKARQMVVVGLGRFRNPGVVPLLENLLDDEDVVVHALIALGNLKALEARPSIERLLIHPNALVRGEAQKALAKYS
jgi:HEAT repeat protein